MQYAKFKKLVTVTPLAPDTKSLNRIEELKRKQRQNAAELAEKTEDHEREIKDLETSKVDNAEDKDALATTDREISEMRQRISAMKEQTEE